VKRLATAIAAIGLIGAPASAAEMAVKAPAPAPVPVNNWTGWYAGVNAGASFGRVKTDFNVDPITTSLGTIPGFTQSGTTYPSGFIGGGQIGYNWQFSPIWVVGLEADIQGALEKDIANLSNSVDLTNFPFGGTGTAVTNYTTKIDWFGTVRGRVGYVWGDGDVLTYVTGGFAYGKVEFDATSTVSGTAGTIGPPFSVPFSTTHVIAQSHVNVGWTVGFGTEGRLAGMPGWTWKVESLYMDLDDGAEPDAPTNLTNARGGLITGHTHFTDGILRGGLNLKFN
jgi:outer membrane immunogenic protein